MQISSFGKSFLDLHTKKNASSAFIKFAIAAARKRHPDLIFERLDKSTAVYKVPSASFCTCLLIEWRFTQPQGAHRK